MPLVSQVTRLELGGGVTGRINAPSLSSPMSTMNSRSALARTRNKAAFEAHSARDIRGDPLFPRTPVCCKLSSTR